jgi:hypothetical protein
LNKDNKIEVSVFLVFLKGYTNLHALRHADCEGTEENALFTIPHTKLALDACVIFVTALKSRVIRKDDHSEIFMH